MAIAQHETLLASSPVQTAGFSSSKDVSPALHVLADGN